MPKKSGGSKALIGIVAAAVVLVGGYIGWKKISPPKPDLKPQPANNQGTKPQGTQGQGAQGQGSQGQGSQGQGSQGQGSQGQGSQGQGQTPPPAADLSVKQVASGTIGVQADMYDTYASYLGGAKGSQAWFYKFNTDGTFKQIGAVNDTAAGDVLNVAVGDLLNNGTPVMVVSYTNVLYVVRADGTSSKLEDKTSKVLIGDYTGDGQNEGLFVLPQDDGNDALQVIQFSVSGEPKELALVKSPAVPVSLMPARVHTDGIDLLSSFRRDGDNLVFTLSKFDSAKGLVPVVEYPVADSKDNPAEWYGTGPLNGGAGMVISRSGAKPEADLYQLNVDGAADLGGFYLPGGKTHAVVLGKFQGDASRIMSIDENGKYYIYQVQ